MADRVTVTLHELVAELDIYADAWLRQRHGITFNLFEFLATLSETQPIDITGLARCLRVSKAAVSKRVPALVADGWIATSDGPGRSITLTLTPAGSALVQTAGGELEAEFTAMLADPRVDPQHTPGAVSAAVLNAHLSALTQIIIEKGDHA